MMRLMKNSGLCPLFCAVMLCIVPSAYARSAPLLLKHADYNENTIVNRKLISVLRGNVVFHYEESIIKSDYAKWYRRDGVAQFKNNVHVDHNEQNLTCDYMDFYREKKLANLKGNIDFYDSLERTRITAQRGIYHTNTKDLELDKKPRLYRYDSSAVDTMIVISKTMSYNDSSEIATAIKDVEILKGDLSSYSQIAYYYLKDDIAKLRQKPHLYYDVHEMTGDSVDLLFINERLRGVTVTGNAHGVHRDEGRKDTIITDVTGDSLYMSILEDGSLDSLWVYGNTRSSYYPIRDPSSENVATGKVMVLSFNDEGQAETLEISGNATSTYYVEDKGGKGRNEASGDRIHVLFESGKARYMRLTGSVRGIYFAKMK